MTLQSKVSQHIPHWLHLWVACYSGWDASPYILQRSWCCLLTQQQMLKVWTRGPQGTTCPAHLRRFLSAFCAADSWRNVFICMLLNEEGNILQTGRRKFTTPPSWQSWLHSSTARLYQAVWNTTACQCHILVLVRDSGWFRFLRGHFKHDLTSCHMFVRLNRIFTVMLFWGAAVSLHTCCCSSKAGNYALKIKLNLKSRASEAALKAPTLTLQTSSINQSKDRLNNVGLYEQIGNYIRLRRRARHSEDQDIISRFRVKVTMIR